MELPNIPHEQASFNQVQFQQYRLHELFSRLDRLGINPLLWNSELSSYNYQIMFNDLTAIFSTIYSKLKPDEKRRMLKLREDILTKLKFTPIFCRTIKSEGNFRKKIIKFNNKNWSDLSELLFKFRLEMEILIDSHGFGNPSKQDPRRSIISK